MVLVRVVAVVSKDDVRRDRLLQLFEDCFHFGAQKRHETIAELLQPWPLQPGGAGKQFGASPRLGFPYSDGAEDHPVKFAFRVVFTQPEDGTATANFDVVGMGSQAQNVQRFAGDSAQVQLDHLPSNSNVSLFEIGATPLPVVTNLHDVCPAPRIEDVTVMTALT